MSNTKLPPLTFSWPSLTPGLHQTAPVVTVGPITTVTIGANPTVGVNPIIHKKNMAKIKNRRYTIKLPRGFNGERCAFTVSSADDFGFKEATLYAGEIRGIPVYLVKQSMKHTTVRTKWAAFTRRDIVNVPANIFGPIQTPLDGELIHVDSASTMSFVVNRIARQILNSGATAIPLVNTPTLLHQLIRHKAPWKL